MPVPLMSPVPLTPQPNSLRSSGETNIRSLARFPVHPFGTASSAPGRGSFVLHAARRAQGDRWQSAPPPLRYKAQDFTTIFVLEFAPNGTVLPITWRDQVTVEF